MARPAIRLFTDEHVHAGLAAALRERGYDAESCQEAGRDNRRVSDDEHLSYTAQQGRAILTNNVADFVRLDREWKAANRQHAGILVYAQTPSFTALLRRVARHLDEIEPEIQRDTLLWLAP